MWPPPLSTYIREHQKRIWWIPQHPDTTGTFLFQGQEICDLEKTYYPKPVNEVLPGMGYRSTLPSLSYVQSFNTIIQSKKNTIIISGLCSLLSAKLLSVYARLLTRTGQPLQKSYCIFNIKAICRNQCKNNAIYLETVTYLKVIILQ